MDATSVESIALISNSNTNKMSCGSSSSASSGYASATTTPTNPSSVGNSSHSEYADTHSTTPVGMVEPRPTSVPTIATISPYYNETYQHQPQPQPQQQRQPTHSQNPHPHATQQEYQQHQTHSYQLADQMQSPTLSQYSNSASNSSYDSPHTYLGSTSESYVPPTTEVERNLLGMRHTTAFYTTSLDKPNRMAHTTQLGTQPTPLSHIANTYNSNNNNKNYNNSNESVLSLSQQKRSVGDPITHAAKPQATATPFYAQPTNATANAYPEPYKNNATKLPGHKLSGHSIDYTNYGNPALLDASPYVQTFTPYHGSKMLQDIAYGTGQAKQLTPLTNVRMPQQRLGGGIHYSTNTSMPIGAGSSAGVGSGSGSGHANGAYIDKYVYSAVSAAPATSYYTTTQPVANPAGVPYNNVTYAVAPPTGAPTAMPPQYGAEMTRDTYRKPTAAASSWHWSVEYPNGNCLPPPPQAAAGAAATHTGLPTAAIPPTNASFVPASNLTGPNSRDIYYATDKYNNSKYDKYNTYYNPHQQYTSGRNVWANTPPHAATHLVPAQLTERLPPHPHHAYAHHASPLSPGGGATYQHAYSPGARQNCCSQTFQTQNCYYPRTAHYPTPAPFFANTYNPHTAQPIQYAVTGAAAAVGRNVTNNSTGRYSMLDYAHASKSKVNTNDLYAGGAAASNTPPNYDAASLNYHSYQPTTLTPHNQQQYTNAHATAAESALSANTELSTAYYNDLNMQPTYENFLEPLQAPALIQQRRESLVQRVEHLPNLSIPYTKQPQSTLTGSMIDYQKHTTGATINDDCFMGSGGVTLTNLDEHMATNMRSNYENSAFGELPLSNELGSAAQKSDIPTTPTTKTYSSLRDFLSTWNEDEDDYGCAAELKFVENETQQLVVEQEVLRTFESISHDELTANKNTAAQPRAVEPTQPANSVHGGQEVSETYQTQPQRLALCGEDQVKAAVKNQKDANNAANTNLPDIIIDIEKSNVAAQPTQTTAPRTTMAVNSEKSIAKSTLYNIFDVEKELDELVTKKIKLIKTNLDAPHIRTTGSVIKKVETEAQCATEMRDITSASMFEQVAVVDNPAVVTDNLKTFDDFEYVDTTTTSVHPLVTVKNVQESAQQQALTSAVQAKPDSTCDRGIESENTTSSNGSTFEKEYETFINKIGNVLDLNAANSIDNVIETPDISSDVPQLVENHAEINATKDENIKFTKQNSDSDLDIAQKIKSYSKFYKRKRTYSASNKDNECKKLIVVEKTSSNINSNFPLTYTKRCRKRECAGAIHKIRLKALRARLTKFYSYYQRRMRTLRRYDTLKWKRLYTKALLKQYISTKLLETSLSLSASKKSLQLGASMNETQEKRPTRSFEPQSLKCLCVSFINSDMFRKKLLKANELKRKVNVKKYNFMKNAKVNEEHTNDAALKEYKPNTQQEIIEKSYNSKRSLQSRDIKEEDLNDNQPDKMENACKKLKLDVACALNSQACAADVEYKNELIVDNSNDFKAKSNVSSTDYFENITENEKVNLNSSEAEEENCNVKTPLTLQQQKHEGYTARLVKYYIDDKVARNVQQANNSEHVVTENEPNAKVFDNNFEVHETLENVMEIKSLEQETQECATIATEYHHTAEIQAEIGASKTKTIDKYNNEKTNEIRSAAESEEIAQETFGVAEQLQNDKEVVEELTRRSSVTFNLIEDDVVIKPELQEMAIDSTAADNATASIEEVKYGTMDPTSATDNDQSPLNANEESFGCFSEHELETISLHLRSYSNQSNSESKLEGFASPPETEEITKSIVEKANDNENAMDILAKEGPDNEIERKSIDREHDFSETDNSVDMFGARKSVEYFTTESKNYFQHGSNIDESSTDSRSSSSSSDTSSSSSSNHKNASTSSSSSSSNTSSDEDTQSSTTTEHSIFNEMKELKKELSQHQINEMNSLWLETEEEQKTEAAAKRHVEDNSNNDVVYEKPIENDNKTLKNILQCDSEEHEDIEIADDKKKQDEKLKADKDTKSLEHKQINALIATAEDNDETNEDSNEAVTRRGDIVCFDAVNKVLDATKPQNYADEIENVVNGVCAAAGIVEDNPTTPDNLATTTKHNKMNVLSFKNIALDFLERENSIKRTEDALKNSKIPKLSDLCKNALSSSFELSSVPTNITNQNNAPDKLEHELSVEEALAEMYRQVGVTSDVDDGDDEDGAADVADVKEAQDVVLINLEEILVNDSDLYVLQCDMNENVLSVVTQAQANNLSSMITSENIDDIEIGSRIIQATDVESAILESMQAEEVEMRNNALTTTTTDYRGPFMGAVDEDIINSVDQLESGTETSYTYMHSQPHTLEFVEDHSLHSQFSDFPAIHHEEIVSQDSKRYKRQLLYNSLREKYVLRRMNFRIQHGNRVLKKYINRWILQCLIARFRERELRKVQQLYLKE